MKQGLNSKKVSYKANNSEYYSINNASCESFAHFRQAKVLFQGAQGGEDDISPAECRPSEGYLRHSDIPISPRGVMQYAQGEARITQAQQAGEKESVLYIVTYGQHSLPLYVCLLSNCCV